MNLRQQIQDLGNQITSDVHQGEVFYEEAYLKDFQANLDKMKVLAEHLYDENRKEIDEE